MRKIHPFRFGILGPSGGETRQSWHDRARAIEDAGYSSVLFSDHPMFNTAPIACMVTVAEATSKLKIGSAMFGNDFRHPVVLAQEAAMTCCPTGGWNWGWARAGTRRTMLCRALRCTRPVCA